MLLVYNDEDIINEVIENLLFQGLELVVLDNGSTDSTYKICENFLGKGILQLKQFKTDSFISQHDVLHRILYHMALTENPDWLLRSDSDEFFETGITNKTLKDGIQQADSEGYNLIQFDRFDFFMTEDDNESVKSIKEKLTYYSCHGDYLYRAWKHFPGIRMGYSGGHYPIFPEGLSYKIYHKKFVMRHYKFRSTEQAKQKMHNTIRGTTFEKSKENKDDDIIKTGLNKHIKNILQQDFTRKVDHKLLTKYNEDEKWNYEIKYHPYMDEIPPKQNEIFTEDGKLKIKQKNVWELHMELQEMREHLKKGKLFATLYFLRNQLREKFKK